MVGRLLLTLLLLPASVMAQVNVAPNVESVASGGYWERNGTAGRYRVVVVNSGFEAVTSRLFLQWVQDPRQPGESPKVVASVEPALPFGAGVATFTARLSPEGKGRARVIVEGVVSRDPSQKVRAELMASNPGEVAP